MNEHELLRKVSEENIALKARVAQLEQALDHSNTVIADLSARLDIVDRRAAAKAHRTFVTNSERFSSPPAIEEPENEIPEDSQFNEAESDADQTAASQPKKPRKPAGRIPIDPNLPREDIIVTPKEFDRICTSCAKELVKIGEDVVEVLDYVPSNLKVKRYILEKYACPSKDSGVLQAPAPNDRIIPRSIAGNGLLAASLSDKFIYHLPYARQSIRFRNIGFPISRQNLSRWQLTVSSLLNPLVTLIEQYILAKDVIHLDETTLKVMGEKGRENTKTSYIWLRVYDGPDPPAVSYRYYPSRGAEVAEELLETYSGMIQTDAYAAYKSLVRNRDGELKQAFCLAHARRKFYDIFLGCGGKRKKKPKKKPNPTVDSLRKATEVILTDISAIFALESELRAQLSVGKITEDQFLSKRKQRAAQLFKQLRGHLDGYKKTVIPQTPFAGAINYTLNQWDGLQTYLETPLLTPDNSRAERAVSPVAIGRKNWNVSGSPAGAKSSCAMYTILQTAVLNKLDPGAYLHHVLDAVTPLVNLPYRGNEEAWENLLPWKIDPDSLAWPDRLQRT